MRRVGPMLIAAAAVACGPEPAGADTEDGGADGSDSDASAGAGPGTSDADGASGSAATGQETSATTGGMTSNTAGGSSTTGFDGPVEGEWAGVWQFCFDCLPCALQYCPPGTFTDCSTGLVFSIYQDRELDHCTGVYARMRGTMYPAGTDGWTVPALDVEEFLELSSCEVAQCPAGEDTCEPVRCEGPGCSLELQDCPDERCLHRRPGAPFPDRVGCEPIAPDPGGPWEPCRIFEPGSEYGDDCDAGLLCWSQAPDADTGTCVPYAMQSEPQPCAEGNIAPCSEEGALCLPVDCVGCTATPYC